MSGAHLNRCNKAKLNNNGAYSNSLRFSDVFVRLGTTYILRMCGVIKKRNEIGIDKDYVFLR